MDSCGCDRGFEIFDRKSAEADLARYREHGPDRTTRLLLDMIESSDPDRHVEDVIVAPTLIVRQSTAPAPARA